MDALQWTLVGITLHLFVAWLYYRNFGEQLQYYRREEPYKWDAYFTGVLWRIPRKYHNALRAMVALLWEVWAIGGAAIFCFALACLSVMLAGESVAYHASNAWEFITRQFKRLRRT